MRLIASFLEGTFVLLSPQWSCSGIQVRSSPFPLRICSPDLKQSFAGETALHQTRHTKAVASNRFVLTFWSNYPVHNLLLFIAAFLASCVRYRLFAFGFLGTLDLILLSWDLVNRIEFLSIHSEWGMACLNTQSEHLWLNWDATGRHGKQLDESQQRISCVNICTTNRGSVTLLIREPDWNPRNHPKILKSPHGEKTWGRRDYAHFKGVKSHEKNNEMRIKWVLTCHHGRHINVYRFNTIEQFRLVV